MPLFQVVILEKPKKKDAENGNLERLVLGPINIVSTDTQAAALSVIMDNADMEINRNRMDVQVRPFM